MKNKKELAKFQNEMEKIAKIAVLYPCKKNKLYNQLKKKYEHLLKK